MCSPLILEGLMLMFSLTYPPWHSKIENNLRVFIAELSDFNSKLYSPNPTRLLFQYMKTFSKRDKLKSFIGTKMKNIIIFLDNNRNWLSTKG